MACILYGLKEVIVYMKFSIFILTMKVRTSAPGYLAVSGTWEFPGPLLLPSPCGPFGPFLGLKFILAVILGYFSIELIYSSEYMLSHKS